MLAALFTFFNACRGNGGEGNITVTALHAKLTSAKPPVVIDVRNPDELKGPLGSLDVAINIPLPELEGRLKEFERFKNKEVVVICRSGNRSGKAVTLLQAKGIKATNIAGGMIAWRDAFGTKNK
jgi:rhodanese-related sulfurtransferase